MADTGYPLVVDALGGGAKSNRLRHSGRFKSDLVPRWRIGYRGRSDFLDGPGLAKGASAGWKIASMG
jgi:hypothetical protein